MGDDGVTIKTKVIVTRFSHSYHREKRESDGYTKKVTMVTINVPIIPLAFLHENIRVLAKKLLFYMAYATPEKHGQVSSPSSPSSPGCYQE